MRASIFFIVLVATPFLAGCTRTVPPAFPRASAASHEGAASTPARVGRAIVDEPPLPGEQRPGWEALDRADGAADGMGHRGHGGHGHAH